ncbi:hypothetical protein, partial [Moraxella oblonga]|uniref:hypothetical protein n=1 Tax=Moraxella oblonga TaxID=200413 RepID=UPI001470695A
MAAFGRNLMNGFLRQAWQFYEGDESLAECLGIKNETARMLSAKYCFEFPPKQYPDSFSCAIIRAACENNLVVVHGDFECVFLPDGTALDARNQPFYWHDMVEENEQIWQTHIQELIAKQDKPQIPVSQTRRDSLAQKILKARLGKPYADLLKKYNCEQTDNLWFRTEFCFFEVLIITDKNKFDKDGLYYFDTNIILRNIKEEDRQKMTHLIPRFTSSNKLPFYFIGFYGLSNEANPNIKIQKYDSGMEVGEWAIREYDEWVKLIEAAADMIMYYLPHIGTADDFIKFVQAHDAGETNFAQLTLPETNPALRQFCVQRNRI